MRILVIEDDMAVRDAIVTILAEEAYSVDYAEAGDEGLYAAEQGIHDVIVLDIMLPEISGLDIVKTLRSHNCDIPILLLTARDSVNDRVIGLETGADDYLVKPFAMEELLARIKALLRRRSGATNEEILSYGGITLNNKVKDGIAGDQPIGLGGKEFAILEFLILNKEQILTREQIFDRVWGMDSDTTIRIVDIYVHYLRKKLAAFGLDTLVQTVYGSGFMVKE